MTTSHRSLRFLTFITAASLLLLGPVAFGSSVSAADDASLGSAASEPVESLAEVVAEEEIAPEEITGEAAGAEGGSGTGGPPTGVEGEHGDTGAGEEGDHGDEGDHGEETAQLVCLATGDRDAPYTAALVMPTAVISGEGRVKKEGPASNPVEGVFPAEAWGNIVPELTHPSGASFAGLNWNADGQRIWADDCGTDVPPSGGHDDGEHGDHATVVVCIATDDSVTPYTLEKWMVQAIINGHGMPKKEGPASDPIYGVFPAEAWGNIIPVVTHPNKKATYPGLNLEDGGQAILEAGCVYVAPAVQPPPAPAPAPKDFCPDLDGVQWENYDCDTPQAGEAAAAPAVAVVTAEPAPAVVPELAPTPASAAMPAEVSVPTEQTIPAAVDAGGAPASTDGIPTWAILMLVASCIGAAAAGTRVALSEPA